MILRLKDIVQGHDFSRIEFRMYLPDGKDIFLGVCKYENGELLAVNKEKYSLNIQVLKYHLIDETKLIVWVEDWGKE